MAYRKYPSLPVLHTKGNHYDVGYNIGANFSQNIHMFFQNSKNVQTKIMPFYDSRKGREYYEAFLKVTTDCYPQFVTEVKGMSDGSGMVFENLFLLNMSAEIKNILYLRTEDQGCSTIFVNSPDVKLLVHNEDCDPLVKPFGYMVNAEIDDVDGKERFLSFCYPGILPGNSYNVNGHGTVVTINGQYPDDVTLGAPPRYFLNRSLMRMSDIIDGKRLALNEGYGCAYAFCANVASIKDPKSMYFLEIGPGKQRTRVYIHEIREGTIDCPNSHFRCNKYQYLDVKEDDFLRSSENRTKRATEFGPICKLQDALAILGDTKNEQYPIYRTPRPTDAGETVCTAAMDLLERTMTVYHDNPKISESNFIFSLNLK
ncbi:hypothetical protein LOTGIDRAFT_138839 [Lottia gigantea]|uniref:Peptidase C45 hydrolase domain-containing protein n=1 Tax=Lottia gigantea TaxID=225164 RepID=V4B3I1_LOTGI|nr:hypothetical protein LOTGIDRAFT_138839 [Lottia gigantea]ESP01916.1 hypothetical protein LOTGIDRAFT_138839 [Lottia gigantea]